MIILKLATNGLDLIKLETSLVTSDNKKSVSLEVTFDDSWTGYGKSATFKSSSSDKIYEVPLADNACVVPWEVLESVGTMSVGVRGVKDDGLVVASDLVDYKIAQGAKTGDGTSKDPTPTVYEQLLSNYGSVDQKITKEIQDRANAIATEKSERMTEVDVERKRIDNIVKLPSGSTSGDAELMDIRIGADGTTYDSAGTAVREQISSLKEDLGNLANDTGYPIIRGTTDGKQLYYSIDTRIPVKNGHTYLFEVVNYSGNYSNGVQFRVVDAQGNASTVETLHENSKSKYTADKDYNSFIINVLSTQKEIANFEVSIQDTSSLKIQLSAKMEEISNKSEKIEKEIQNNYILQSVYPHFHIGGRPSNNVYPSKSTWEKYFESFKNAGLKGYILAFDIQPTTDSATSFLNGSITEDDLEYFMYPDAKHYLEIISLGEKYGMELKCVKFHNQWMKNNYTKITFEKWFAIYRHLIISVLDDFKNRNIAQNCEWCTFLNNSASKGINDSANVSNVRAFFNTLHSRYSNKYKLGITGSVDDDTLNNYYGYFDCIMPFEYPPISSKGEMTTYEDSLTAWKSSMLSSQLIEYKTKYPNTEVIICETGCKNYYDSLIMPELDSYYTGDLILSGRPFSIFLYGLLEMAKRKEIDNVSSIWLYYTDDLYPDTQELIKKYIGGGND